MMNLTLGQIKNTDFTNIYQKLLLNKYMTNEEYSKILSLAT